MADKKWHFEDFKVGDSLEVGSYTIGEEEIISFARQYDPQPFHVDREAATKSIYGGLIASGWQTVLIMMRTMVDNFLNDSSSQGSPGVDELRWLRPVRPGDTLTFSTTVLTVKPSNSKPDRGIVQSEWSAKNQSGEVVATMKGMNIFLRRPS
ncbi:MAG: MaoC family dehydratase [Herminiimonas sp.]|nr:MaoC family dehydratase [Herminiimonas sp.]MDB5855872.1 MaoC family dehydratase [Herminiimonas sp.]